MSDWRVSDSTATKRQANAASLAHFLLARFARFRDTSYFVAIDAAKSKAGFQVFCLKAGQRLFNAIPFAPQNPKAVRPRKRDAAQFAATWAGQFFDPSNAIAHAQYPRSTAAKPAVS
jgi:hypothetical protein